MTSTSQLSAQSFRAFLGHRCRRHLWWNCDKRSEHNKDLNFPPKQRHSDRVEPIFLTYITPNFRPTRLHWLWANFLLLRGELESHKRAKVEKIKAILSFFSEDFPSKQEWCTHFTKWIIYRMTNSITSKLLCLKIWRIWREESFFHVKSNETHLVVGDETYSNLT